MKSQNHSKQAHTAPSSYVLPMVQAAMIAALYIVLTFLANALGLASGAIQIRFSEALTILPYFTPAAIPGIFVGCLLSNILTGCALPDIVFGSLATLAGGILTGMIGQKARAAAAAEETISHSKNRPALYKWLSPLPPIAANTLIVPLVLLYAYGIRPLWLSFITVFIGEAISCGILGMLLLFSLQKYAKRLF